MAEDNEKSARRPSRIDGRAELDSRGVAQLVEIGRLLDEFAWPRNEAGLPTRHSPERETELRNQIYTAENDFEPYIYRSFNSELRRLLGVVGQQAVDIVAVRVVAYTAFCCLLSYNSTPNVGQVAKAISLGVLHDGLEGRRIIYELIQKGTLVYTEGHCERGEVGLGQRLKSFLNGDKRAPLIFDKSTFQQASESSIPPTRTTKKTLSATSIPPSNQAQTDINSIGEAQQSVAKNIFRLMEPYVIGKSIAPSLRRYCCRLAIHLERKRQIEAGQPVRSQNEAILILGNSGSGKSHIIATTAKVLSLPVATTSAADLTAEGYCGLSVSDTVRNLMRISGNDRSKPLVGLLHTDEIDKKASRSKGDGLIEPYSAPVLHGFMTLMEGGQYQVGGRRSMEGTSTAVSMAGVGFIFSGAFVGLDELLAKSKRLSGGIGFGSTVENKSEMAELRDGLISFGMLEEFINRLTCIVRLPTPSIADLEEIAVAPKGVISAYNELMSGFGITTSFNPSAIRQMSEWAYESKSLARGLKLLVSYLAEEAIFDGSRKALNFDGDDIRRAITSMATASV
mgnify:CR=1 FL=1